MRISFLKSNHDVLKAASNKSGGRKARNTISESSLRSGKNGVMPIIKPANTSSTGLGNFILSANAESIIRIAIKKITISKFAMRKDKRCRKFIQLDRLANTINFIHFNEYFY